MVRSCKKLTSNVAHERFPVIKIPNINDMESVCSLKHYQSEMNGENSPPIVKTVTINLNLKEPKSATFSPTKTLYSVKSWSANSSVFSG